MYFYGILLSLAILMSFGAGFLSLKIPQISMPNVSPVTQVNQLKQKIQTTKKEQFRINSVSMYSLKEISELFDAATMLPRTFEQDTDLIRNLYQFRVSCSSDLYAQLKQKKLDQSLQKEFLWSQFQCEYLKILPEDFFNRSPYTSIFGGSYVFKAIQLKEKFQFDRTWILSHLHLMHVLELRELVKDNISLPSEYGNMAMLDEISLRGVFQKEPFVVGDDFVLIQEKLERSQINEASRPEEVLGNYKVYSLSDWNELIQDSPMVPIRVQQNEACLWQEGALCWIANQKNLYRPIQKQSLILFVGSLCVVFISILLVLKKIQTHRREEERKKFALQTLTHELRTPIASLMVTIEDLLNSYDQLPQVMQNQTLKIANDVQRLKRLAEISRQYLNVETKQMMKFHFQKIESLNQFVQDVLDPYKNQISFELLKQDQTFHLDSYWIGLCLKNLVENAIHHGAKPITISLLADVCENKIVFQVKDFGVLRSYSKKADENSMEVHHGMGLGLSIVKKVITEMGGEFLQNTNPTLFGFKIGDKL
ncbi:MAG: HAMP domain-containing histidine kinase [Bdellovibrionaceae bacterium]|nr:HAMP domain-containing histidine kinase [Pseudobdellovibrionaceae bacterium]NUM59935.1 HAMP domain-containing histidine kinase [Pseudobdellovibrionaceae bacterium]